MKSKELAEELLKYPSLDVVVRIPISTPTYDHPYGKYDMQYIDYVGCASTIDNNVVIFLEQIRLIMSIYIVRFSDYDSEFGVGYFTNEEDAEKCMEYHMRTEPSDYEYMCDAYSLEKYELDDTDYDALNKELDEAEKARQRKEEEEFRNKELAELARLKAKYEGQQDDLQ